MRRTIFAGFALLFALAGAAYPQSSALAQRAQRKLDVIRTGHAQPGSTMVFTLAEVNAWAREKLPTVVPQGVRNPFLDLGTGTITATALVDFLKVRDSQGSESSWAMQKLLEGERPVKVAVRIASSNGRATVFLTRLEVASAALSGSSLDFMVDHFLRPFYPDAKINQPFELAEGIDHIDVRPTGVRVTMRP